MPPPRRPVKGNVRNDRRNGLEQLSVRAYGEIRDMIAAGAFPPPTPIREVDLVKNLGMSRTPVREALLRLSAEGVIKPLPFGGYVALELGQKELADIYQVREVLTGLAARLAALHRTRVDLARLEDARDAFEQAVTARDSVQVGASVRGFYRALAEASGNGYLQTMLGRVVELFRYDALAITEPRYDARVRRQNRELIDAISRQDADLAERVGRAQISEALATRLQALEKRSRKR